MAEYQQQSAPKFYPFILVTFLVISLLTLFLMPCIGINWINPLDSLSAVSHQIMWELRIPRVLASFLTGAGLSLCGMTFQSLFRSPLATPFTLGVSSGASLGAVTGVLLTGSGLVSGHILITPLFAMTGALISILFVYRMAKVCHFLSMDRLLLAGVALNYFCGSGVTLIQYTSNFGNVFRVLHTLMGSFDNASYANVFQLIWVVLPGALLLARYAEELNLLMLGDELASSRGVSLRHVHQGLFALVSVVTACIVSMFGPIGFVGMMVPHMGRYLVGGDHRYLWPVVFLLGGILLTVCDTLSRTMMAPVEIPVGIITAMLGCPFFILLLRQAKR